MIAAITGAPLWGAQKYAVVIGVAKYQDHGTPWLQFADRDAELFKTYLLRLGIPTSNVAVVKDEFATTASMRENIRHVLVEQANAGDDVYLFISARGLATHYYRGGFILGYLSRLDHPISTALTTEDLSQLVQQSKANIYVFTDLDRDPPGPQLENTIQLAMKSVWQIHPQMGALFASSPGERSLERKDLDGGHGVFGYYLVKELGSKPVGDQRGEVTLESLFDELQNELSRSTNRKQSPFQLLPEKPSRRTSYLQAPRSLFVLASYQSGNPDNSRTNDQPVATNLTSEEFYASARQFSPDALMAKYRAGTTEEQREQRQAYEVALEDKGEEVFARYGDCGECLEESDPNRLNRQDYETARRSFELAASLAADERLRTVLEAKQRFAEGRILTLDGKYAEAELHLTEAIDAFPSMPELYNALGTVYLEQTQYAVKRSGSEKLETRSEKAVTAFQKAVDEANDWSYARHNLAVAYIRSGDYHTAEQEYREAIGRAPYESYLYLNLGMLLEQLDRLKEAEQEYSKALEVSRQQQQEAMKRKQSWEARPNDLLAADEAAKETALQHTFVLEESEIHNAFGALRESQDNLGSARRELAQALKLNPHLVIAKYQLARVNYEMADGALSTREAGNAVQDWRKALDENPGYLPARIRLAEAYEDEKNFTKAAEEYDAVSKNVNSHVIGALRQQALGDAKVQEGDLPRACEFYHQAEQEITAADCNGEYRDLVALQNLFFTVAAGQNLLSLPPSSAGSPNVNARDFFFQPCRWNHEIVPNIRLDARRFLFYKIYTYCGKNPTSKDRIPPHIDPILPGCLNCSANPVTNSTPEPGTFWLVGLAIGMVVLVRCCQLCRRANRHRF